MKKPLPLSPYQKHVQDWSHCTRCKLHETRKSVVLLRGQLPCDVLFIGEAPGKSENVIGKPFVGKAGTLLDEIIDRALSDILICPICYRADCSKHLQQDRRRLRIALTNLIACMPIDEAGVKAGQPEPESLEACGARLQEAIDMAKPKLIIYVGALAEIWLKPGHINYTKLPKGVSTQRINHPAHILRLDMTQQGLAAQRCEITVREAAEECFGVSG